MEYLYGQMIVVLGIQAIGMFGVCALFTRLIKG